MPDIRNFPLSFSLRSSDNDMTTVTKERDTQRSKHSIKSIRVKIPQKIYQVLLPGPSLGYGPVKVTRRIPCFAWDTLCIDIKSARLPCSLIFLIYVEQNIDKFPTNRTSRGIFVIVSLFSNRFLPL